MATILDLDIPQRYLVERSISYGRTAQGHAKFPSKHRVWYWPSTQSMTLHPINFTPDFTQTKHYEHLKFRLADCDYQSGWWKEVGEGKDGKSDFFFNAVVSSTNYAGPALEVLAKLTPVVGPALGVAANLANAAAQATVNVITSKEEMPANTGYLLRFRSQGRATQDSSEILTFYFGQFALVLDASGEAHLWQTLDYQNYAYVHRFRYAGAVRSPNQSYKILIVPHGKRWIDFHMDIRPSDVWTMPTINPNAFGNVETPTSSYRVVSASAGMIVNQGKWMLRVSQAFRPYVQVSRLGYFSGIDQPAIFYDKAQGLDVAPRNQLTYNTNHDLNGGEISYNFFDGESVPPMPFVSNGNMASIFLQCAMRGVNDQAGGAGSKSTSSRSPEFYGHCVDKPAEFNTDPGDPVSTRVMAASLDLGEAPDQQRLEVECDNSVGQMARFARRGYIPYRLRDDETGLTFAEGYIVSNKSYKSRDGNSAEALSLSGVGMADRLMRCFPVDLNFTQDPKDTETIKRPWHWQGALRRCFEAAGFDPNEEVTFDPVYYNGEWVEASRFDFRLWAEGGGGGASNGSKDGPHQAQMPWAPNPKVPIFEFIEEIIVDTMGWSWHWSLADHKWHIYKRPTPEQTLATKPKAAFFRSEADRYASASDPKYDGIPKYTHANLAEDPRAPAYSAVIGIGNLRNFGEIPGFLSRRILEHVGADLSHLDTLIPVDGEVALRQWSNPRCFQSVQNPNPDRSHPDFMGMQYYRMVNLLKAPSKEAFEWIGRRAYEDMCFGYVWADFTADWGDEHTYNLRKYDPIYIDGELFLFHRAEPGWKSDRNRRARYTATLFRDDVLPPR